MNEEKSLQDYLNEEKFHDKVFEALQNWLSPDGGKGSMKDRFMRAAERYASYKVEMSLKSKWVRVEDGLPETYGNYLTCICESPHGHRPIDLTHFDDKNWLDYEGDVIHPEYWQPLPLPPTKD